MSLTYSNGFKEDYLFNLIHQRFEADYIIQVMSKGVTHEQLNYSQQGYTPFLVATYQKNLKVVEHMLFLHQQNNSLFDINHVNLFNDNCLILSCKHQSHDLTKMLLKYYLKTPSSINVHHRNDENESFLHHLLFNCDESTLSVLKLAFKIKNLDFNCLDKQGQSPFMQLIQNFSSDDIKAPLLQYIISQNQKTKQIDYNIIDKFGYSAFLCAAAQDDIEKTLDLFLSIKSEIDIFHKTEKGYNALVLAQDNDIVFDKLITFYEKTPHVFLDAIECLDKPLLIEKLQKSYSEHEKHIMENALEEAKTNVNVKGKIKI